MIRSVLVLFDELSSLRLKSAPRSKDLQRIASLWVEALNGFTLEEIRIASLLHVRSSQFWPQIAEVSRHLPSREEALPANSAWCAQPPQLEEVEELNAVLSAYCGFTERVISSSGIGVCSLDPIPTGQELYDRLIPLAATLSRLTYWRSVLRASAVRKHKSALTIRIPLRSQASAIAAELLPSIAALYSCQSVIYSD